MREHNFPFKEMFDILASDKFNCFCQINSVYSPLMHGNAYSALKWNWSEGIIGLYFR